jgi:hypothetical protein
VMLRLARELVGLLEAGDAFAVHDLQSCVDFIAGGGEGGGADRLVKREDGWIDVSGDW